MTALTWASTGKFRGELVGNAVSVFVLQNVFKKITISEVVHIAADDNWRADYLSRSIRGMLVWPKCKMSNLMATKLYNCVTQKHSQQLTKISTVSGTTCDK
jgi:hypothetical protein